MRAKQWVLVGCLGIGIAACGSEKESAPGASAATGQPSKEAASAKEATSDKEASSAKPAASAPSYCDVRANEESPNHGTCWEYPAGFEHPSLCAAYRGTVSSEPCPKTGNYVGSCHHAAIHVETKDGQATSTVSRDEFFVHQYDVKSVGGKFPAAKKAECEGNRGTWIPKA